MKSRLTLICVAIIIISYPICDYRSKEINERRAKAATEKRERMAKVDEQANGVIDEDNLKTYYILTPDSITVEK